MGIQLMPGPTNYEKNVTMYSIWNWIETKTSGYHNYVYYTRMQIFAALTLST